MLVALGAPARGGTWVIPKFWLPWCCAQQTGMHILVVEALLIAIFLSEGRANAYRHRKYDRQIVLPIPSHSAGHA
jgi:hypothetical protein